MDQATCIDDSKFEGNILILRRTGCGKTTIAQNLGKNRLCGDIKEVYWISKIKLSRDREKISGTAFLINLWILLIQNNVDKFNVFLETYRRKKSDYMEKYLGENMILDKLIFLDDVSGLLQIGGIC